MFFAKELLQKFQISTQTTAILNLGDALMTYGFEANITSLNKCIFLRILLMQSEVMTPCSILYESPTIFIYNLDLGRHGPLIKFKLTLLMFFKNFLIVDKLSTFASLFIVIMIPLLVIQMKSAIMSNLEFFRHLLTLEI